MVTFCYPFPGPTLDPPQRSVLKKQPTAFKHCKHDLDDGVKHFSNVTRGNMIQF